MTLSRADEVNQQGMLSKLLSVDEAMKRLSYGPPARQMDKLIGLVNAGILSCDFLCDPSVDACDGSLVLRWQTKSVDCDRFVDSVLAGIDARGIDSSFLRNLLLQGFIEPEAENLGFRTNVDGLHLHGRINGSEVVGADSIHFATSLPELATRLSCGPQSGLAP